MSGIVGVLSLNGHPVDPALPARMWRLMGHRLPDHSGKCTYPTLALAHAGATPLVQGGLSGPAGHSDGTLSVVLSGVLFNSGSLRSDLGRRGRWLRTLSDAELLLHLYEEAGKDCWRDMNGQWAAAIWNSSTRSLVLSRDRFGEQPLYYMVAGKLLLFASEIKALFAVSGLPRELDGVALEQLFTFRNIIAPRTAFKGVFELPPGHTMIVDDRQMRLERYWELPGRCAGRDSAPRRSEGEYAEDLIARLTEATRVRLPSGTPVGAYLSGGLDSTVVGGLIKRTSGNVLRTFSVAFDAVAFDESPYQRDAAEFLGSDHNPVCCSYRDIAEAFPKAVWHAERPVLWTAPAPMYILARFARQRGVRVVLTGEGADEILGGYEIYREAKVRRLFASRSTSPKRRLALQHLYARTQSSRLQGFALPTWEDDVPVDHPLSSHLPRWQTLLSLKEELFSEVLKAEVSGHDVYSDLATMLPSNFASWEWLARAEYLEVMNNLSGYCLSSQGDRVAMAHGVEMRFPFLDPEVVECAMQIPEDLKIRALQEKYVFRKAAHQLAPASIAGRRKQCFRAPLAASFFGSVSSEARAEYLLDVLSRERIATAGLFQWRAVKRLVDAAIADETTAGDELALVGVLSTQLLVQQFVQDASAFQ